VIRIVITFTSQRGFNVVTPPHGSRESTPSSSDHRNLADSRVETVNERFKVGDVATNLGAQVRVTVRVLGPPWAGATNVCLFANGLKVREEALPSTQDRTATWIRRRASR
jgi:hypothetical protein